MITKCFKLVQINVKDILPNEPHVVLMKDIKKDETKIAVGLLNAATLDWALHVVGRFRWRVQHGKLDNCCRKGRSCF